MFGVVVACLLGTPAALLRPQNGRKAPPKGLAAEVVASVPPIGGRSLPWLFEQAIKNNVLAFPGAEALARRRRAKISAAALAALLLADPDDCLDEDLRLTRGAVPRELSGTLYVNGPARLKVGTRAAQGRFVKTWAFEVETFFGFNVFRGFFSLPFLPLRELGFAFNALAMWRKNVANTCVVEWPPGQLLALWEMGPPHALDAETLRTTKSWSHLEYLATSDCALSRLRPLLAHTKTWTDGDASTLVGLSALGSSYTFYEFGLDGALAASTEANMPFESSIVHDFAITEDYYVVQENPVVYTGDVGAALGAAPMLGNGSVVEGTFAPAQLLEHDHEAGPFLFETRLDVAAGLERGEGTLRGLATRTLADGSRTHRDFPSEHPAREGRKTRYAYCAASPHLADGDPFFPFHSVQKVDVAGGGPALVARSAGLPLASPSSRAAGRLRRGRRLAARARPRRAQRRDGARRPLALNLARRELELRLLPWASGLVARAAPRPAHLCFAYT
ncbi:oxidoreductase [Aureococcus anophagefferens]|nr:oxidoreductase [Aureococcus anophagefferens]